MVFVTGLNNGRRFLDCFVSFGLLPFGLFTFDLFVVGFFTFGLFKLLLLGLDFTKLGLDELGELVQGDRRAAHELGVELGIAFDDVTNCPQVEAELIEPETKSILVEKVFRAFDQLVEG